LTLESSNKLVKEMTNDLWGYSLNRWSDYFVQYYEANQDSWVGVGRFYEILSTNYAVGNIGESEIVLVNLDGTILAHPDHKLVGGKIKRHLLLQGREIYSNGELIGVLFPHTYFESQFWILQQNFNRSTVAATIKGVCLTSLFAMLLGLAMSRGMVMPLKEFIAKIGRMTRKGKLDEQLPIYDDDEIGELARSFNKLAEEIESNVAIRQQMFADISHELKTPLTVLATKLESALERNKSLDSVEIAVLYDEVIRLRSIVNELQDLSKIEVGQMALERTMVDFKSFFGEFLMLMQAEAQDREIDLEVDIAEDTPYCYADPYRLKQIVLNLVNNALRYNKKGGIVKVQTYKEGDYFVLVVADNGIGISSEDLPYIFQRFYRADKSRSYESTSSGLGLAITKGFIEAHGGSIAVQSQLEKGTIFTVKLPVYKEEAGNE